MKRRFYLPVLFRDEWLVAVHKPAGLLVHANDDAPLRDTCLRRVRSQTGRKVYPCHRLDRATSGVLLFAFSPGVVRQVFLAFENRQVEKIYWAVCRGYLEESQQTVRRDIDGRASCTHFRSLAKYLVPVQVGRYPTARYSLLEVNPETGRRQQIRRHLKHIGHPVLGDKLHGDRDHNRFWARCWGFEQMFLAARVLQLAHPVTGERLQLEAPLARAQQTCLEQLEEFRHDA